MKRGEIWTVSGAGGYAGKPRPVLVVQSDAFSETDSLTVCPFTTELIYAPHERLTIEPSGSNGLRVTSSLMIDKIVTVPKRKFGQHIGDLDDRQLRVLEIALAVFLGIVRPARTIDHP